VTTVNRAVDTDETFHRLILLSTSPTPLNRIYDLLTTHQGKEVLDGNVIRGTEQRYLSVGAIDRYVTLLLDYQEYLLLSANGRLRDPAQSSSYRDSSEFQEKTANVVSMLAQALRVINTAIAQQELMNASATLFAIDQSILDWQRPNTDWCTKQLTIFFDDTGIRNGRAATRLQLIRDKQDIFTLFAQHPALLINWIRFVGDTST
jgi:hypothetical protein